MKVIELIGQKYELIEDDSNCFELEVIKEKVTEYFKEFDYIFGDYSYDKVRLKGFNDPTSKKVNKINNIKNLNNYKKEYCSYGAKTFLLKKVK